MVDFTRITNQVQMRVPGVLADAVDEELKATLFEFFSDAPCWPEKVAFTTLADTTDYEVDSEEGDISMLIKVVDDQGHAYRADFIQPNIVSLASTPTAGLTLYAVYALIPTKIAPKEVPDWVINQYWTGIADGVCARLMSQAAKPYTNEGFAKSHYAKFRSVVADAKREALRAYRFRGQPWRFPGFA